MVYLVDDDSSVRRGFELFVRSAGLDFRSYESAIRFLAESSPRQGDVLVLDLNLPGMSGGDLLNKFRHDGIVLPVIVVTAFDDPASRHMCKDFGVKAYLRKPVDGEALLDLIKYNINTSVSKP